MYPKDAAKAESLGAESTKPYYVGVAPNSNVTSFMSCNVLFELSSPDQVINQKIHVFCFSNFNFYFVYL